MGKLFWGMIILAVIAALSVILILDQFIPAFILPFALALLALYIIRIDRQEVFIMVLVHISNFIYKYQAIYLDGGHSGGGSDGPFNPAPDMLEVFKWIPELWQKVVSWLSSASIVRGYPLLGFFAAAFLIGFLISFIFSRQVGGADYGFC